MSAQALLTQLKQGIAALGQEASAVLCGQYLAYLDLLVKWNAAYNLTGIKDPRQMVVRHILDSLSVKPFIKETPCLDAGTGAGLPGLVLALALPEIHWVLLDGNRKKIRFLNQAKLELGISNMETVCSRVEDYRSGQPFAVITSRALGPLARFWAMTENLRDEHTRLLAMKGVLPEHEISGLSANIGITTHKLLVPGLDEERHLIIMQAKERALTPPRATVQ